MHGSLQAVYVTQLIYEQAIMTIPQESPWHPRPGRPDGVRRPEQGHVPDACPAPCLTDPVIEELARLIARAHDRDSGTT